LFDKTIVRSEEKTDVVMMLTRYTASIYDITQYACKCKYRLISFVEVILIVKRAAMEEIIDKYKRNL